MKKIHFSICFSVIFLFSSCATIIHGSKQNVSISSYPADAVVTINDIEIDRTPVITRLSRKKQHRIKIKLNDYLPYETMLTRKVDAWIAGNIIFGGLIGLAVDAITGGMYKLTPDQIQAELRGGPLAANQANNDIYLTIVLKPKPDWEKFGQLERSSETTP